VCAVTSMVKNTGKWPTIDKISVSERKSGLPNPIEVVEVLDLWA